MCAQSHLAPFLPTHPLVPTGALPDFKGDDAAFGTMAAAPYGSALILPISYAYISMMGSEGLTEARAWPLLLTPVARDLAGAPSMLCAMQYAWRVFLSMRKPPTHARLC